MAARLFETLPQNPILAIASAMSLLPTTRPTATKAVVALIDAGVLVESSGKQRYRSFSYHWYLESLKEGTGLLR